jgi:glucosamine--fructose-6-phosphate aminotransferase (isomerizing)
MCGIFGILSPASEAPPEPTEAYFEDLSRLLAFHPGRAGEAGALEGAVEVLRSAQARSYRLVGRAGFLAVLSDGALRERLAGASRAIREWVRGLEERAEAGLFRNQREGELVNQLIVGGHDLAWQVERDVLQNIEPMRHLLGGEEFPHSVWGHGWQLNLTLNSLNRLEVRGRDSAGLAIYARFPSRESLERFLLSGPSGNRPAELEERSLLPAFSHRALVRPDSNDHTLLFAYKVAEEVGEMGANVRFLRQAIAEDSLFQAALREPRVEIQTLAHTRWASNGVVSLPNCHPVDSTISRSGTPVSGSRGTVVAVLNGDVDNYQELFQRYIREQGLEIDEEITTDAKIIPLVVGHHYRRTGSLEEAFRAAFDEFEGSMAIGIMAADRPGEFLFGQKGSGQGLFLGFAGQSVAIASEMYGLVELSQDYLKAEGERVPGGEIFRVSAQDGGVQVRLWDKGGEKPVPSQRIKRAEITTRDINRGDYPRFLLKEISESVSSVRKTLRGKFELNGQGAARFFLGPEVLDPRRVAALRSGAIRRIIAIGQGTAAIAGSGIAYLLGRVLSGAPRVPEILSMKATELSGHYLRDDMSDTLVIAVSQSGTTTDTNRTVDLVKDRGAWVIAVVNRRNSDLVYKSHGVLYTSDGRDIEMSVASTKAFYAQNVAGQVLALALAEALESLPREALAREAELLLELPEAMAATLSLSPAVKELAERYALRRPYWAVVGSGPGKIAADEIRIKLSELCYKSIATDFLEDKKHIDLSAEPLVLVCANDASPATISDLVKEVAIFKAHRSVPLVVAADGETRFEPYAAGMVSVPQYQGALSYLLATMVGHLFGYHAAASFDRQADGLRAVRTGIVRELNRRASLPAAEEEVPEVFDPAALPAELVAEIARVQEQLAGGAFDSGLKTATGVRLSTLFQFILGRLSLDLFAGQFQKPASSLNLIQTMLRTLTAAIDELARPVDAIKHQAKTVTVGVSRLEEARPEGILWSLLRSFGLPIDDLAQSHRVFLSAFEPLVAQVEGATLYRVSGLDAVGRPRAGSTIRVEKKMGAAMNIFSRCEEERPLIGTKWGVVKSREIYIGYGQTDSRKILIVPIIGEKEEGSLVLYHLELLPAGDRATRLRALAAHRSLLERLKIAVTERNQTWEPSLIDRLENEVLFLRPPDQVAEELAAKIGSR